MSLIDEMEISDAYRVFPYIYTSSVQERVENFIKKLNANKPFVPTIISDL